MTDTPPSIELPAFKGLENIKITPRKQAFKSVDSPPGLTSAGKGIKFIEIVVLHNENSLKNAEIQVDKDLGIV